MSWSERSELVGAEGWEGRASFVVVVTKRRPDIVCSMVDFNGVVLAGVSLPCQWKIGLTKLQINRSLVKKIE
jgi:hypothetical protein